MSDNTKTINFSQEKTPEKPEHPPIEFIKQIASKCPMALELYFKLWDASDKKYHIVFPKKEAHDLFSSHPLAFKTHVNQICNIGLLSFFINHNDIMKIELVGWQDGDF